MAHDLITKVLVRVLNCPKDDHVVILHAVKQHKKRVPSSSTPAHMASMDIIIGTRSCKLLRFSVNSGMMLNMFDLTAAPISSYGDRFKKKLLISLVNGSVSCFSYEKRTLTNDEFQVGILISITFFFFINM
jgi:hypothetical protein